MATVQAFSQVDFLNIDLNFYYRNFYDSVFDDNVYLLIESVIYEDFLYVNGWDGVNDLNLVFGGSGFRFSQFGSVVGGTVTVIAEAFFGGDDIWYVTGISLSAVDIYNAAQTFNNIDDLELLRFALSGHDFIDLSDWNDRVDGFEGNDLVYGRFGDDSIFGGGGNDTLDGEDGNDFIFGGLGNDRLIGSLGSDFLDGGDGFDIVDFSFFPSPVSADLKNIFTSGATTGYSFQWIEGLIGGIGDDTLGGDAGANRLEGGIGSDSLLGDAGNDTLFGGEGNDTLVGGLGDDRLTGGAGADSFDGSDGFDTADYSNQVVGLTVDLGTPGTNTGVAAGDTFVAIEALAGGTGSDVFTGDDSANRLGGNLGNDTLNGAGGNDTLSGWDGNDILEGGLGNDLLIGGAGFDRVLFTGSTAVVVSLGAVAAQDTGYGLDTFVEIEAVTSGNGNDQLTGNELDNALNGGLGDDTIRGSLGNDTVNGADGNDLLFGGPGNDLIIGGDGIDTAVFAGAAVTVNLALLVAQNTGLGFDTLSGIENVTGSTFSDTLIGDSMANRLDGDAGNDTLFGGEGNDTLVGGLGDDRLTGGAGTDLLEGGLGADHFVFNLGTEYDTVADFQAGLDRIVIETGADTFSDLIVSEIGIDTVVAFSGVTITLANIAQAQITDSDFLFV